MAKYYRRDPAQYSADEVQAYLLHMVKDRHISFSSMNQSACAARFLYETVLGHEREQFHIPMAKVPVTQPELLSREGIARLFATCTDPVYRMILQTIYATGLRVFEACALGGETLTARLTACVFGSRMAREQRPATPCCRQHFWNLCEPTYARPRLVTGSFARVAAGDL